MTFTLGSELGLFPWITVQLGVPWEKPWQERPPGGPPPQAEGRMFSDTRGCVQEHSGHGQWR